MSIQQNFPAIKPSLMLDFANTKALDPRITFTRASTGTFYNGVTTAKAEENLFQFSQEFDNAFWTKSESTVTANNQTAPDGTSTAETMTENTSNALHRVFGQITSTAITYTASCFFKAGTRSWAYIRMIDSGGTGRNAFFNLSSGVLGTVDSGMSATITSVGNGWYRCSTVLTAAIAGTNTISLGMSSADNTISYTGDGTSTLLLWGAQLEQRSAVTAYTATTTQPITNYIPVLQTAASGVARFEHNPVTGESLGLEIEEQRTNLFTYSEQFDISAWTKTNATITANTIVSPAGTVTGDSLITDTTSSPHYAYQIISLTSGTSYTMTVYARPAGYNRFMIRESTSAGFFVAFDVASGTVVNTSGATGTISAVGNGWYRCSMTMTAPATVATVMSFFNLNNTGTTYADTSFLGNGFSGIYIWGAQLEAGAFATSYIPTVASQVTRAADAASMTGTNFSSWYNQAQGTVYVNASGPAARVGVQTLLRMTDGTANNVISGFLASDGTRIQVVSGGSLQADQYNLAVSGTSEFKYAFGYAVNNITGALNTLISDTDSSAIIPATNNLQIGSRGGAADFFNGNIRKIAYYPLRVSNNNLQAFTS